MTKKEATALIQALSKAHNICALNIKNDCAGCPLKLTNEEEKYNCMIRYDDRPCDWILTLFQN